MVGNGHPGEGSYLHIYPPSRFKPTTIVGSRVRGGGGQSRPVRSREGSIEPRPQGLQRPPSLIDDFRA